jgi:hypothetical protein
MMSWGAPAGLSIRGNNDENLLIFRKALGINVHREVADANGTLEEGRKSAMGIYRTVIDTQTRMMIQHALLQAFLYFVYFVQIIIGAALTALGATSSRHETVITILGAFNTVLAGVLALIKGSGQPQKLGKDRIGYRRLQDWIEETEATGGRLGSWWRVRSSAIMLPRRARRTTIQTFMFITRRSLWVIGPVMMEVMVMFMRRLRPLNKESDE